MWAFLQEVPAARAVPTGFHGFPGDLQPLQSGRCRSLILGAERLVPALGRASFVLPDLLDDYVCELDLALPGAQAIFAGPQDHRVSAMTPQASGRGYGHIAVRVGRILVYLEDRDALQAWTTAIGKAVDLADSAFGPDLPDARYQPRGDGR